MNTSNYTYKTLFLALSIFTIFYLLPGYVQIAADNFNPFQGVKFDSSQENCESFVMPVNGHINLPAHNLNTKTDTPHYLIVYDLSNYTKSNHNLAKTNFSETELNSYQDEFYTNSESSSQKLPFEKALRSDILLI